MRKAKRTIVIVILLCAGFVPVCSAGTARTKAKPQRISVSELLDKFAETQDRLQSIILKSESRGTKSCYRIEAGTVFYSFGSQELRYDGKRICVRANHWGQLTLQINAPKQQPQYMSTLWDGKTTYYYIIGSASVKEKVKGYNPSGTCHIYQPIKRNQTETTLSGSDVHIFGYFCGDRERFDTILRKANSVKVLKKMEKVNGSDCFVIVADTKYGKYKIWLEPNHGYHIAKAVVERGPGDFVQATNYTHLKGTKDAHIIQNTRFKKFDGIWIPIESTFIRNIKYQKDDWAKVRYHKKITEVILNPDHEALSSFAPDDIKNGAKVRILGADAKYAKGKYTWQDGKVVDEKGRVILDCRPKKASGSAESKPKSAHRKRPSAWELLRRYATQKAKVTAPRSKERIVHFPPDCSLGKLMIQDAKTERHIETFFYWTQTGDSDLEYLGQAQGSVTVPAGKRLALYVSQDAWRDLSPLSNLKPDDLHTLSIYGPSTGGRLPDDRCMPHIAHLTGLKVLHLVNTNISAKGMGFIKSLKSLERLSLSKRLTDEGLAEVARLPSLKGLYLQENRLTNAGLAHLAGLTSLEELDLGGGRINDAGLAHLAKVPRLRYLVLQGKNFTDAGTVHLKNIPSLRILHLGHLPGLTNAALVHLSEIPNLERLSLHWNENITDAGIVHLKKLHSLKMLDIVHSQVTDRGLAQLKQIKSLEYLNLPGRRLSDRSLAHLAQLNNLKHLRIARPHKADPSKDKDYYTDKGLEALSRLRLLEDLSVGSLGVTDEGMSHIAKLTNLKDLSLFGCPITNEGLARLTTLKSLEKLYVKYAKITISGLAQLNALSNLTVLDVCQVTQDNSVLDISGLTKLEKLTIGTPSRTGTVIRDEDLACLARLKRLKWFQISSIMDEPMAISDAGMAHLAGLTNLERITIGGANFTDKGLSYLADMKKLNLLNIIYGNFTDKGLEYLEGLKALRFLSIVSANEFSSAALRRLQEKLPNLQRINVEKCKEIDGRLKRGRELKAGQRRAGRPGRNRSKSRRRR